MADNADDRWSRLNFRPPPPSDVGARRPKVTLSPVNA